MRDLYHVTLDTGDVAMIPPDHLQDATREMLRPVIEALIAHGEAQIDELWRVAGVNEPGRCLSATVLMPGKRAVFGGLPVAWIGVGAHSRCGARLWEAMHQLETIGPVKTDPSRPPATPWLATRMLPGAASLTFTSGRDLLQQLADLSECLAWTWIERSMGETNG